LCVCKFNLNCLFDWECDEKNHGFAPDEG